MPFSSSRLSSQKTSPASLNSTVVIISALKNPKSAKPKKAKGNKGDSNIYWADESEIKPKRKSA